MNEKCVCVCVCVESGGTGAAAADDDDDEKGSLAWLLNKEARRGTGCCITEREESNGRQQ